MNLKKALDIINYCAYIVLEGKKLDDLLEDEKDELMEARDKVKSFIKEFD